MKKLALILALAAVGLTFHFIRGLNADVGDPVLITTQKVAWTTAAGSVPINVIVSSTSSTVTSHVPTYQKTWSTGVVAWNTFSVSSGQGTVQIKFTGNPDWGAYCELQGSIDGGVTQYTILSWSTNSNTVQHITNKTSDMTKGWCTVPNWTTAGTWQIKDRFIGGR